MAEPNWDDVRLQFPALCNWTCLNTATFGQTPVAALRAVERHFARRDEFACADFLSWYDDMDAIRAKAARLISAEADDFAFVTNASQALSLLTCGLEWNEGDHILTIADEFPNQLYAQRVIEVPWERFYESVGPKTRAVAISEVNYASGFRPPLGEIGRFLRERGVLFYADGTQSTGALRFDVRDTPVDMLAVHGYKWLVSPSGAGFTYIAPSLRKILPPSVIGWRSHETWRSVDDLHHGSPVFTDSAEKYEGGGLPFPALYGMEAALDLLLELGPEAIERRVLGLAAKTRLLLQDLGAEIAHTNSQIVAAKFPGHDPSALANALRAKRVIVAARHGYLRVSPHFYNNEEDIAVLGRELAAVLSVG